MNERRQGFLRTGVGRRERRGRAADCPSGQHPASRSAARPEMAARSIYVNRLISIVGAGVIIACAFAPAGAADMAAAKRNYHTFCASCHGSDGKGDGPVAATLATHPAHFSDCTMMSKMSDDTMFNVIKHGGGATGRSKDMPAWGSGFEDGEIHDLVAFLMTFCESATAMSGGNSIQMHGWQSRRRRTLAWSK